MKLRTMMLSVAALAMLSGAAMACPPEHQDSDPHNDVGRDHNNGASGDPGRPVPPTTGGQTKGESPR